MLNKVVLIGRLAQDPELRYTPNGVAVGSFGLAVERPFTNRQGERDVDFVDIVTWRRLAETCANHLGKGRLVAVEGRLQVRKYENQQGQRRTVYEIVADDVRFLDWPSDAQRDAAAVQDQEPGFVETDDIGEVDIDDIDEDDVPF